MSAVRGLINYYLSIILFFQEQCHGHVQHLKKHEQWLNKWSSARDEKFTKHRSLEDEYMFLKQNTDWDFKAGSN